LIFGDKFMTAATPQLRFWVDMALECVRRDHTPSLSPGDQTGPFLTARALGMALAALNDAHAYASRRTPLLSLNDTPGLASVTNPDIAGAAACAQVLRLRYPNQASLLESAWIRWLEYFKFGPETNSDQLAGRTFGTAVHKFGDADISKAAAGQYTPTGESYTHTAPPIQPTQGYAGARWGEATPLLATRVAGFPFPPGRISDKKVNPSPHYTDDFTKVTTKGYIDRSLGRSLEEEVIGIAWGYDGPPEIGTPPRLYMQVVLTILDAIEARMTHQLSGVDELQIVAGVAIAMADAGIDAWYYKYNPEHMMWRPAVGVRNAIEGNGVAVPNWLPLGRPDTNGSGTGLTPDFPAYPSGHATFGAAAFQLLRLFLVEKCVATFDENGIDNVSFDFVSDEFNGRNKDPRTMRPRERITLPYDSLWQAIIDNSVSRVYLGVHWEFDGVTTHDSENTGDKFGIPDSPSVLGKTGGVWLGAQIANQIAPKLGITQKTINDSKIL
jgi:vanadium chloroperoxidase